MALDTAAANRWVLTALEPKPGEQILELGCGHGRALGRIGERVGHGEAWGVDPSEVMCAVANRYNRKLIESGRVRIERGDAEHIPARDGHFDKVLSVHTIYFWTDLEAGLREIGRVIEPGGQLLLAFHSSENTEVAQALPASVYTLRSGHEIVDSLSRSGFHDIQIKIDPQSQLRLTSASR
jgi:ubiquinone/menaquinone biosynthesis C-methylase UbiE